MFDSLYINSLWAVKWGMGAKHSIKKSWVDIYAKMAFYPFFIIIYLQGFSLRSFRSSFIGKRVFCSYQLKCNKWNYIRVDIGIKYREMSISLTHPFDI